MLMIGKELTAQQRLYKAVVDIMGNETHMAIAPVLMIGTKSIDAQHPTAYTDGINEVYGEGFINELSDAELRFLVLHESYHKLYQHLITWQHLREDDADLANQACDYVINLKLVDADKGKKFIVMPSVGCFDERFRDMDTAQVFNILKQDRDNNTGSSSGQPLDEHGWEEAKGLSDLRKKQLQRDLDSALRQGALLAGKSGSGGTRDINNLLQPQVDWREQLREFVQTVCAGSDYSTWRRPNRRYVGMSYYLPSGVSESMDELVVAVDTSGSIGQRELTLFLSELASVCDIAKPSRLRVLYWDTKVCAEEVYEQDVLAEVATSTKPAGGGGTDVTCVVDHLQAHDIKAQAVLVLTDGYLGSDWGEWDVPTLWCLLGNRHATSPVGKTIHIKE